MEILGVKIDDLSEDEVLLKVEEFLGGDKQRYVVTPNPEFLVEARGNQEFKEALNQADLSVADGAGLVLAARFLGQPPLQRLAGVDLMAAVCARAAVNGWPVFLLGGREGVAEKAAAKLRERHPSLKVQILRPDALSGLPPALLRNAKRAGRMTKESPQNDTDSSASPQNDGGGLTQNDVVSGRPGILFVALGAPKQEKWIVENLPKMPAVKLAVGVGGAFDFISGRVRRAPRFVRTAGLEWLWRFGRQPWRLKRIFKAVVVFPWLVAKEKIALSTRK